jgi:cupin 2 domain-containing protein
MQERILRGALEEPTAAPALGERVSTLLELPGLAIEQILSGALPGALSFCQEHDEWVLVVEGRARLLVEESEIELGRGEWLLLRAGCPHSLLETEPGTSWLAVHLGREH